MHGPSIQAAIVASATLMAGIGVLLAVLGDTDWHVVVAALGWVVAVGAWLHARRHGRLEPFIPHRSPVSLLAPTDRRDLRRQLRGVDAPTPRSVEMVDAIVRWQRRTSAATLPSLIGLALVLLGNPRPLVPVLVLATSVLLVVLMALERRRWARVQRLVAAVRSEQPAQT
ncbi:hypothetical protein DEJ23_09360 [Curtobacterium sp. MCSS17_008]|nr:hypothetical protein DEJ23_09360 [Curtobacterium sp. MCSS17_008]